MYIYVEVQVGRYILTLRLRNVRIQYPSESLYIVPAYLPLYMYIKIEVGMFVVW